MKLQIENIYLGTIRKCTKYEPHTTFSSEMYINGIDCFEDSFGTIETDSEIYKENAVLIKVVESGYVDLETLKRFSDAIKVKKSITRNGGFYLDRLILGNSEHKKDCLFVDESTLRQYEPLNTKKATTVKQLKKSLMLDPRYPRGINN